MTPPLSAPATWDTTPPQPPRNADLYVVVYVGERGHQLTTLFRLGNAAQRFAAEVEARGGTVAVYTTPLPSSCWKPVRR